MLKLVVKNLAKNALDDLAGEKLFADTDKGKFVLRPATYEDELVYLVIKLHERGKLTWFKDNFGRYVAEYKGLKIEISDSGIPMKRNLAVTADKDQYVLSRSPLIDTLSHVIWHVLDTPHAHLSNDTLRDYFDKQRKVAEKVIDILKSR